MTNSCDIKNLLIVKEFISTLPNADDVLNINDIETELLKLKDKKSEVSSKPATPSKEPIVEEEEEGETWEDGGSLAEAGLESFGISIDKENTVAFAIALRSLFDKPLSNIKVVKNIPDDFKNPVIIDTTEGRANIEGDKIVWTIDKEMNEERTKKIIRLLEYEIENKKEASDKEIIRIAGIRIDELDEFKELISKLPQESFDGNPEIAKMATETINKFDNPTLYDLLNSLKFDIKTARKVGKYLVEKKMIESLSRIEGSAPSETSSKSRPVEIYCEECRTILTDRENPKFCPLCGSTNLSEKTI